MEGQSNQNELSSAASSSPAVEFLHGKYYVRFNFSWGSLKPAEIRDSTGTQIYRAAPYVEKTKSGKYVGYAIQDEAGEEKIRMHFDPKTYEWSSGSIGPDIFIRQGKSHIATISIDYTISPKRRRAMFALGLTGGIAIVSILGSEFLIGAFTNSSADGWQRLLAILVVLFFGSVIGLLPYYSYIENRKLFRLTSTAGDYSGEVEVSSVINKNYTWLANDRTCLRGRELEKKEHREFEIEILAEPSRYPELIAFGLYLSFISATWEGEKH